ncbi:energy transducer TonB [Deltaproteobacteria bacterium PRO3]|nr:energy transducer TonB [Deltaproteobacteria bacterium PRO3]
MLILRAILISSIIHLAFFPLASWWNGDEPAENQVSSVERRDLELSVLLVSGVAEPSSLPAPAPRKVQRPREQEEGIAKPKKEVRHESSETVAAPTGVQETPQTANRQPEGISGAAPSQGAVSYEEYLRQVQRKIARRRSYPSLARQRGIEGRVTALLVIDGAGRLVSVDILKSDHDLLSDGALATIRNASPFPAPPTHLASSNLKVSVPITYRISEMDS